MRPLLTQLVRFTAVGGVGFVVDVALFNLLRVTVLAPERMHEGPVVAKVISTTVAIILNWLGNRYWTFGEHRRAQALREGIEFFVVSLGGMLIGLACLWISHYLLGFTSATGRQHFNECYRTSPRYSLPVLALSGLGVPTARN